MSSYKYTVLNERKYLEMNNLKEEGRGKLSQVILDGVNSEDHTKEKIHLRDKFFFRGWIIISRRAEPFLSPSDYIPESPKVESLRLDKG